MFASDCTLNVGLLKKMAREQRKGVVFFIVRLYEKSYYDQFINFEKVLRRNKDDDRQRFHSFCFLIEDNVNFFVSIHNYGQNLFFLFRLNICKL